MEEIRRAYLNDDLERYLSSRKKSPGIFDRMLGLISSLKKKKKQENEDDIPKSVVEKMLADRKIAELRKSGPNTGGMNPEITVVLETLEQKKEGIPVSANPVEILKPEFNIEKTAGAGTFVIDVPSQGIEIKNMGHEAKEDAQILNLGEYGFTEKEHDKDELAGEKDHIQKNDALPEAPELPITHDFGSREDEKKNELLDMWESANKFVKFLPQDQRADILNSSEYNRLKNKVENEKNNQL